MNKPAPRFGAALQTQWDLRAAANFIFAGSGAALLTLAAIAWFQAVPPLPVSATALCLVGLGLFCVWLEIGRPWRFLHVFFHPQTSWMTREASVAVVLFAAVLAGMWWRTPLLFTAAGALGLLFLYCQGLILRAAKGIPAWREPAVVSLLVSTGLAEGAALLWLFLLLGAAAQQAWLLYALCALLLLRLGAWLRYRQKLAAADAPAAALAALDGLHRPYLFGGNLAPLALLLSSPLLPAFAKPFGLAAGGLALLGGWGMKLILITRAARAQGYALGKLRKGRPVIKPPVRREKDRFVFDRRYRSSAHTDR